MHGERVSRRDLLAAAAAGGAVLGLPGVAYADDQRGHVAFVTVSGHAGVARLDLSLMRDDGATQFRTRFEQRS